jgi:hypothetical protein
VRAELAKGTGIITTAKRLGLGNGTVHRIRREMAGVVMAPSRRVLAVTMTALPWQRTQGQRRF